MNSPTVKTFIKTRDAFFEVPQNQKETHLKLTTMDFSVKNSELQGGYIHLYTLYFLLDKSWDPDLSPRSVCT